MDTVIARTIAFRDTDRTVFNREEKGETAGVDGAGPVFRERERECFRFRRDKYGICRGGAEGENEKQNSRSEKHSRSQ